MFTFLPVFLKRKPANYLASLPFVLCYPRANAEAFAQAGEDTGRTVRVRPGLLRTEKGGAEGICAFARHERIKTRHNFITVFSSHEC